MNKESTKDETKTHLLFPVFKLFIRPVLFYLNI